MKTVITQRNGRNATQTEISAAVDGRPLPALDPVLEKRLASYRAATQSLQRQNSALRQALRDCVEKAESLFGVDGTADWVKAAKQALDS